MSDLIEQFSDFRNQLRKQVVKAPPQVTLSKTPLAVKQAKHGDISLRSTRTLITEENVVQAPIQRNPSGFHHSKIQQLFKTLEHPDRKVNNSVENQVASFKKQIDSSLNSRNNSNSKHRPQPTQDNFSSFATKLQHKLQAHKDNRDNEQHSRSLLSVLERKPLQENNTFWMNGNTNNTSDHKSKFNKQQDSSKKSLKDESYSRELSFFSNQNQVQEKLVFNKQPFQLSFANQRNLNERSPNQIPQIERSPKQNYSVTRNLPINRQIDVKQLEEQLPLSQIERFQDIIIDASETQFNRLGVRYVEELIKLSSVIMYKVKNSKFYRQVEH